MLYTNKANPGDRKSDIVWGRRGVYRLTDQRILTVFSPGFRIQSKILTDLRILQLQRFAVFIDFWARSLGFASDKVWIVEFVVFFFVWTRLTECHAVGK